MESYYGGRCDLSIRSTHWIWCSITASLTVALPGETRTTLYSFIWIHRAWSDFITGFTKWRMSSYCFGFTRKWWSSGHLGWEFTIYISSLWLGEAAETKGYECYFLPFISSFNDEYIFSSYHFVYYSFVWKGIYHYAYYITFDDASSFCIRTRVKIAPSNGNSYTLCCNRFLSICL